jgi:hypothetical protein
MCVDIRVRRVRTELALDAPALASRVLPITTSIEKQWSKRHPSGVHGDRCIQRRISRVLTDAEHQQALPTRGGSLPWSRLDARQQRHADAIAVPRSAM